MQKHFQWTLLPKPPIIRDRLLLTEKGKTVCLALLHSLRCSGTGGSHGTGAAAPSRTTNSSKVYKRNKDESHLELRDYPLHSVPNDGELVKEYSKEDFQSQSIPWWTCRAEGNEKSSKADINIENKPDCNCPSQRAESDSTLSCPIKTVQKLNDAMPDRIKFCGATCMLNHPASDSVSLSVAGNQHCKSYSSNDMSYSANCTTFNRTNNDDSTSLVSGKGPQRNAHTNMCSADKPSHLDPGGSINGSCQIGADADILKKQKVNGDLSPQTVCGRLFISTSDKFLNDKQERAGSIDFLAPACTSEHSNCETFAVQENEPVSYIIKDLEVTGSLKDIKEEEALTRSTVSCRTATPMNSATADGVFLIRYNHSNEGICDKSHMSIQDHKRPDATADQVMLATESTIISLKDREVLQGDSKDAPTSKPSKGKQSAKLFQPPFKLQSCTKSIRKRQGDQDIRRLLKIKNIPAPINVNKNCQYQDLNDIGDQDLQHFVNETKSAEAIIVVPVFVDGTNLLHSSEHMQKPRDICALLISNGDCSNYVQVNIPGCDFQDNAGLNFKKELDFIKSAFSSEKSYVCYEAQLTLGVLARCLTENDIKRLRLVDPKIASWLLNPDNVPDTFDKLCCSIGYKVSSSQDSPKTLKLVMANFETCLKEKQLWGLFELETALCPILALMERRCINVDIKILNDYSNALQKELLKLEEAAHNIAGSKFSLNSPAQLRQVCYEELKLDRYLTCRGRDIKTPVHKSKSTAGVILKQLQDVHPLPKIVLKHRQMQKLRSTYIDGILPHVVRNTLCTKWSQTAAASGRLTSMSPNIQSIPKESVYLASGDGDTAINVRKPYFSKSGWSFLSADFCQVELRLLAHFSEDPKLCELLRKEGDIFVHLSAIRLQKSLSEVVDDDRTCTKQILYSLIYGIGKSALGLRLNASNENIEELKGKFLREFPGIERFTKECIEKCKQQGYATSLLRRRRYFPDINSTVFNKRCHAERQAINFCIQASAADLCKAAMLKTDRILAEQNVDARLLLQLHDELLWEVQDSDISRVCCIVQVAMESPLEMIGMDLKVPIKVHLKRGKTWAELRDV